MFQPLSSDCPAPLAVRQALGLINKYRTELTQQINEVEEDLSRTKSDVKVLNRFVAAIREQSPEREDHGPDPAEFVGEDDR